MLTRRQPRLASSSSEMRRPALTSGFVASPVVRHLARVGRRAVPECATDATSHDGRIAARFVYGWQDEEVATRNHTHPRMRTRKVGEVRIVSHRCS